ncbi:diguanylate cyclase domain-containing protein [Segnochrobactraceae bacterium EtOH-i3]
MTGAFFALSANLVIALLIAGTFILLSRLRGAPEALRGFALSYVIGAMTPANELLVRLAPVGTGVFEALSYTSFTLAFLVMAAALQRYYGVRLSRGLLPVLFVGSLGLRVAISGAPRDSLLFGFAYQLPFILGTGLCAIVVMRGIRGPLDRLLAALFAVAALHFLLKPPAAYLLGAGATARDYVNSAYALFSQAASGLVLVAVALALILVVVMNMTAIIHRQADVDGLSGLLNRRAFDREATARLQAASVLVLMVDIDHFKQVNDTFGHAAGDRVIQTVAARLNAHMPEGAVIGRTGGEEFSVLLAGRTPEEGMAAAEALRAGLASVAVADPGINVTLSGGLAVRRKPEEALSALMARADRALYVAKARGRNQIVLDAGPSGSAGRVMAKVPG